jgi:type II secretory pathway component PulF
MRKYYFKAQSAEGAVSGSIEAGSVRSAKKELVKKGYLAAEIKKPRKFSNKIFWSFIEALDALLDKNTTLSEALSLLTSTNSRAISEIANQLNSELSEGSDFLYALESVFYDLDLATLSLLRIGYENAGLETSLSHIINTKIQKNALLAETQKAVAYPIFVLVVSIFVLVIIFDNVLPEFNALIVEDSRSKLTMGIMSFAGKGYDTVLLIFWSVVVFLGLIITLRSKTTSKLFFEKVLNTFPVLGGFLRLRTKINFLENMSLALTLKSDLRNSLKFSVGGVSNGYHQSLLLVVEKEILEGVSFEEALLKTGLFDRMELLRIGLAEKAAKLPETFQALFNSNILTKRKWVQMVIQLLGPFAIIILGIIVFFVAFAVVTPMMSLQNSVG